MDIHCGYPQHSCAKSCNMRVSFPIRCQILSDRMSENVSKNITYNVMMCHDICQLETCNAKSFFSKNHIFQPLSDVLVRCRDSRDMAAISFRPHVVSNNGWELLSGVICSRIQKKINGRTALSDVLRMIRFSLRFFIADTRLFEIQTKSCGTYKKNAWEES